MKVKVQFLTFLLISAFSFAQVIKTEKNEGFHRVKLYTQKNLVNVTKLGSVITLKTLNNDIYESLSKAIEGKLDKGYFSKHETKLPSEGNNVFTINLYVKNGVEVFSFYKAREKAYFLDLWKEEKQVKQRLSAVKPKKVEKKAPKKVIKKPTVVTLKAKPVKVVVPKKKVVKNYRDFRYGAAFVWNNKALLPSLQKLIRLNRKTPEFFYPVKDRDYEKNDREAHIQLTINLYRKKKYGLMYKSIKLYDKKYGEDKNTQFNEYLKANALLRDSQERDDLKPIETAVAMYSNIADASKNYDLRKGINKYLLQYYLEKEDHIKTLSISKKFFADAKENFDYEELKFLGEVILYSLANLNQIEKIEALSNDKTFIKIMPYQKLFAYEMYTLLKLGKPERVIKKFEGIQKSKRGNLLASIIYNAAESYFREADYKNAVKAFDLFLSKYSFHTSSSKARLRIALGYELLGKGEKEVEAVYKNAINRSKIGEASLEARVRYVAYRTLRKLNPTEKDLETRVFLDKGSLKTVSKDLERLLWLVRLRSFIVDGKYENALTFLTALPLSTMKQSYRKVFEADGAEIVYGIIKDNYEKEKYSRAIRAWEIYKNVYFQKVAADPEIQFIVAKSYMNMGLWEGFQRTYSLMVKKSGEKVRTYPLWINRTTTTDKSIINKELQVIKNIFLKNWSAVTRLVDDIQKINKKYVKADFYRALAAFNNKKYGNAEKAYESFFSKNANFTQVDGLDLIKSVRNYLESIYEQGKYAKFLTVSKALLGDAKNFNVSSEVKKSMKERVNYLRVEVLFNRLNPNGLAEAEMFLTDYENSTYINRIKYLVGKEHLRLNNYKRGEEVLNKLINGKDVDSYIKEMAKAELTLLNLKKRTI